MYKQFIATIALTISLLLTTISDPSLVGAQAIDGGFDTTTGQTETGATTNEDRGFDWRWLLPLLAVPVIFMMFRGNREEDRTVYTNRGLAGTKGGEAHADIDE